MKIKLVDTAGSGQLDPPPQTCFGGGGCKRPRPSCRCRRDEHLDNIYLHNFG